MKKWIVWPVLVLGLSVLTSGVVRPGGVAAYEPEFHPLVAAYATWLWSNPAILSHNSLIQDGSSHEDKHDHVYDRTLACVTATHFWDADKGPDDPADESAACSSDYNAWQKARVFWGMALGEYHSGDKAAAYEYLGHVVHLLTDMTVPAHAHNDTHAFGETFEEWMDDISKAELTEPELDGLIALGPVEIPDGVGKLYYLFYTTSQIGGFYASDDEDGDSDDPEGWADFSGLEDIAECRDEDWLDDDCDYEVIRRNSYLYSIRAVAALYELFEKEANQHAELTVVIDKVLQLEGHGALDDPDYFVKVDIGGLWFMNEGDQQDTGSVEAGGTIEPGWAFARNVGLTGLVPVVIQLWDDDSTSYDHSDIDPVEDRRDLDLTIDLANGAISGDLTGTCGVTLTSYGQDDDRSQIWFRILAPNAPPVADAGPDQTVDEADLVTLNGSFTDPNVDDTHTFLWHLESSTNGQAVPDATTQSLSFTAIDDGVYTFSFTVTDNHGAQGSDTVVVTAENVPPVASIDSITDETGAEIGVDVPVALVGLEIDLAGSFTDVGTVDTHTAEINWGDGNTDTVFDAFNDCLGGVTGTLSDPHIYAAPGVYTITLKVTDDDGGVGTPTAQIEVVDAAGAVASVVESLTPLADDPNIQAAIDKLQGEQGGNASNGALDKLEQGNPNAALEKIKQALAYLEAAEAADPSLDLTYDKGLLGLAAKSVAVNAIAEAEAVALDPNDLLKIQQGKDLVAEGDALLAAHDYVGAVDKYQQAVRAVQNIR